LYDYDLHILTFTCIIATLQIENCTEMGKITNFIKSPKKRRLPKQCNLKDQDQTIILKIKSLMRSYCLQCQNQGK